MANRIRNAEEAIRRKMVRTRFRNLIRSVSLNRVWLYDTGEQKFSLNVKKNIAMLIRTKRKTGLLTMAEKCMIRTHHSLRTTEEREKLVSLMTHLTCFSKLPPKVRARLAQCIKFMVINPGRKLIREGDLPLMVYFLLTGEVEVSRRVYDHIKKLWVDRIEKISGPGDCIGEIEMLEKCRRRHTYTSTNVIELLVIFDEDFERVLRPVMEKQWIEKKIAIQALDYFKFFTSDQLISACKLCVLQQFEPLEAIYNEDKGHLSYVYFVVSGECMILQCIEMMVTQKNGEKVFNLVDASQETNYGRFQELATTKLLNILRNATNSAKMTENDIDTLPIPEDIKQNIKISSRCDVTQKNGEKVFNLVDASQETNYGRFQELATTKLLNILRNATNSAKMTENDIDTLPIPEDIKQNIKISSRCDRVRGKLENHFIDVGSITFGGIVGLGENIEHRVIMARTTVQCLMIPRFWLFEKDQNPGNIWQRRRFYLNSTIPSHQMLFKDFVTTGQWQKFKKNTVRKHLGPDLISNPTRVEDVPIICRIVEVGDD